MDKEIQRLAESKTFTVLDKLPWPLGLDGSCLARLIRKGWSLKRELGLSRRGSCSERVWTTFNRPHVRTHARCGISQDYDGCC